MHQRFNVVCNNEGAALRRGSDLGRRRFERQAAAWAYAGRNSGIRRVAEVIDTM